MEARQRDVAADADLLIRVVIGVLEDDYILMRDY